MADRRLKVWYDQQCDYVEVIFEDSSGWFRETTDDRVMKKVDERERVIGFSIADSESPKKSLKRKRSSRLQRYYRK